MEGRFAIPFALLINAACLSPCFGTLPADNLIDSASTNLALGQNDQARVYSQQAIHRLTCDPNDSLEALAYYYLASAYQELDSFELSLKNYDAAIDLAERSDQATVHIKAITAKGMLLSKAGDFDAAKVLLLDARAKAERHGDPYTIALCHNHLGNFYFGQDLHQKALESYAVAYDFALKIGDQPFLALCLQNMSSASSGIKNYPDAERYIKESIAIYKELGEDYLLSEGYRNLLYIYSDQEKFEEAHLAVQEFRSINSGAIITMQADMLEKVLEVDQERAAADQKVTRWLIAILGLVIVILGLVALNLYMNWRRIKSMQPRNVTVIPLYKRVEGLSPQKAAVYVLLGIKMTAEEIGNIIGRDRTTVQHLIKGIGEELGVEDVRADALKYCNSLSEQEQVLTFLNALSALKDDVNGSRSMLKIVS